MRVQSSWVVAITILAVIALNLLGGESEKSTVIYSDDSLGSATWQREDVPVDRWVGIVVNEAGWERLPAAIGVPWTLLGERKAPDFEKEVAIVSYMGAMPTGGHAIALRRAEFAASSASSGGGAGRLTLTVWAVSPGPEDIVTQAFTYPLNVVTLPRDAWPQGALEGVLAGTVEVIVVDQDGRIWGPAHVPAGDEGME